MQITMVSGSYGMAGKTVSTDYRNDNMSITDKTLGLGIEIAANQFLFIVMTREGLVESNGKSAKFHSLIFRSNFGCLNILLPLHQQIYSHTYTYVSTQTSISVVECNCEIITRGNVNKTKQKHAELYQNMLDNYIAFGTVIHVHAHAYTRTVHIVRSTHRGPFY